MHLIIDGYGGDPHGLADLELVRALLDTVPHEMGMVKIAPPYVCRYEGPKPNDWGISGFVLIAESHLSVHTFPERGLLWADIFSCRSFDADRLVEAVREPFPYGRRGSPCWDGAWRTAKCWPRRLVAWHLPRENGRCMNYSVLL